MPASNRESKKVIGLTRGQNSASDLIHELRMEFVALAVRLLAQIRLFQNRRVFIRDMKCIDDKTKESDFFTKLNYYRWNTIILK